MVHVPERVRRAVEQRAAGRCEYCHAPQVILGYRLHVEHIIPRARGGANGLENLALSCSTCNFAKGSLIDAPDPAGGAHAALFNPRVHAWADHFAWASDGATLVGTTTIGRATVVALNMNQPLQLAARPLWRELGLLS